MSSVVFFHCCKLYLYGEQFSKEYGLFRFKHVRHR